MIYCRFFDAGPWLHDFTSNVLNLCNPRILRILTSPESGFKILRKQRKLERRLPARLLIRLKFGTLAAAIAVLFSVFGTACQTEYKTVLDPLGPIPGGRSVLFYPQLSTSIAPAYPPGEGSLLVVTPTGLSCAGSSMYFPHLSYFIESTDGWPVRCVANHRTRIDETPQVIQLPAGRYTLVAEADGLGKVRVTLEIASGRLTRVVLQRFRGENDVW